MKNIMKNIMYSRHVKNLRDLKQNLALVKMLRQNDRTRRLKEEN